MNNIIAKIRKTDGAEYIAAVLRKYRVIAVIYAVLCAAEFIVTANQLLSWSNWRPIHWLRPALMLVLPVGIVLAIFLKDRIKFIRYALIAGFAVHLFDIIYVLCTSITTVVNNFALITLSDKIWLYIGYIGPILLIAVAVLFLLILVFNIQSKKIGVLLCSFIIIYFLMYTPAIIYRSINDIYLNVHAIYQFINAVTGLSWFAVQIFIAWHLIKPMKLENVE